MIWFLSINYFICEDVQVENDPSKLYQGVHFGKYSSKRTDFTGKQGPGPGEYDVYDPVKLEVQHMNTKTLDKRSELQVLRYPDSMLKTAAKDVILNSRKSIFLFGIFLKK